MLRNCTASIGMKSTKKGRLGTKKDVQEILHGSQVLTR
jgi:hypothetical protein